jgi:hypothetical protein
MTNIILSLILLPMVLLLFVIIEQIQSIRAESPNVEIFPSCGALTDHRVYFTINGFNHNGNVISVNLRYIHLCHSIR